MEQAGFLHVAQPQILLGQVLQPDGWAMRRRNLPGDLFFPALSPALPAAHPRPGPVHLKSVNLSVVHSSQRYPLSMRRASERSPSKWICSRQAGVFFLVIVLLAALGCVIAFYIMRKDRVRRKG